MFQSRFGSYLNSATPDLLLASDSKIQQFLQWIKQKSLSVNVTYKLTAVRGFYLYLALDLALRARALNLALNLRIPVSALALALDPALDCALDFDLVLACALLAPALLAPALVLDFDLAVRASAFDLDPAQDDVLKHQLQQLHDRLPDSSKDNKDQFKQWWKTHGIQWREDLRQVMIIHRNIGHDWQFTDDQRQLLQQYHDANLLLVELLNSYCYVSRHVRESIETTLLLPIEELRMRNVELRK